MSGEVSCDLVEGSYCSEVMNILRSKYRCVHEPPPAAATPDDRGYMTSLCVFEDPEVDGSESRLHPSFSNLMVDLNTIDPHVIKEKIKSVLKDLKFREEHVLVQFWSPVVVKRRSLLMTLDQPFGLGVADEKLYSYRKKSERNAIAVDVEQREKLDSPGRVYCQKMPEWSLEQDTCYNIHGYINLPVFESSSDCCVGVLEIITSSSYVDFAVEVQEVSRALKNQNLKSSNVIEDPSFIMADDRARHEHDEILNVLKTVCDIHNLPLAQTWGPAAHGSYVSISENVEQSCGTFNKSCIGKACMSTAGLPFYIHDLSKWDFHEACKERHVYKSQGVVGRSLSSCGTWFCEDVTELDEDDYPLVHRARMSGLTSCLAIYLQSLEAELVIEIFLPSNTAKEIFIRKLMETVKKQLKNSSWMQLDIQPHPQVLGEISFNWCLDPPSESVIRENEITNSHAVSTSQSVVPYSDNEIGDSDASTTQTIKKRKRIHVPLTLEDIQKHFGKTMDEAAAILKEKGEVPVPLLEPPLESENFEIEPSNSAAAAAGGETSPSVVPYLESAIDTVSINPIKLKRKRKRQERSITLEEISRHFGKTMDEAAAILEVSRSTLKRICRNLGVPRWPYKNGPDAVTENVSHGQHEQANMNNEFVQPETTIKGMFSDTGGNVTIKATHRENTVKFTFRLSDGPEKLKELVAKRFQLKIESFRLKYLDEDGDTILIACENDLTWSLGAFRRPESKTVIELFVELVPPLRKRKTPERLITLKDPTENVIHQQEQANMCGECVQPETENGLLKGLEWMQELFATRSYHEIGSFRLNTRDEYGGKILIARENDLTGSSVSFQYIQPNTPIRGNYYKTGESVTVKAKYGNNTLKFTYHLLDGLEKLKGLIATLFQLEIGSFGLKYMDEDGDMILIACESDLMGSSGAFRQPNDPIKTKIKLFEVLVTPQCLDA